MVSKKDEEAVTAVVQKYIDATYRGDVEALRQCFHTEAAMSGYLGSERLQGGPEPFFQAIGENPPMATAGAPYVGKIASLEVVGRVASARIEETGFAGDLSFTDWFHLIEDNGEWKIVSKAFTTRQAESAEEEG